jgi:hypothetical protein
MNNNESNNEKSHPSVTPTPKVSPKTNKEGNEVDELLAALLQDKTNDSVSGFHAFQVLTASALQQEKDVPMPAGLSERIAARIAQESAPIVPAQPSRPTIWQNLVALFRPAPMRYGMGALGTACALGIGAFLLRPTAPVMTVAQEGTPTNTPVVTVFTPEPTAKPETGAPKLIAQIATPAPFVPEVVLASPQPAMVEMPSVLSTTPAPKQPAKILTVAIEKPNKTNLLNNKTEKHNPVIEPPAPLHSTPVPMIEATPEPRLPKPATVVIEPSVLTPTPSPTLVATNTVPKVEPTPTVVASNVGEGAEPEAGNAAKSLDKTSWYVPFAPMEKKTLQKQNTGILGAPIPTRGDLASRAGDSRNKDGR